MSDARILLTQSRFALLTASRNVRVIVFGVAFPIVFLVFFNGIFGGSHHTERFAGGRIATSAYYTAGMIAYAIMLQAFSSLAIAVVAQRETGQLKRLRGTPMPAWTFIGAQVLRSVALAVLMIVALLVIGAAAYGVEVRAESLIGIAVYAALGTAAMATLGLALTPFLPTADAAAGAGPFTAVILSFVSGVFIPLAVLPNWLEQIGRVFPLFHLAEGMQRALHTGTGLTGENVAVLAAWGVAGLIVAARRFRWEPLGA